MGPRANERCLTLRRSHAAPTIMGPTWFRRGCMKRWLQSEDSRDLVKPLENRNANDNDVPLAVAQAA